MSSSEQQQQQSTADWLRAEKDAPLIEHVIAAVTARGRSLDDVTEVLFREFLYGGVADGDWKTYEQSHIGFYDIGFADKTMIHQWWHHKEKRPLTYAQAKSLLDTKRLTCDDQRFLEEEQPQ